MKVPETTAMKKAAKKSHEEQDHPNQRVGGVD
jgi:hypothetical protein